MKLCCIVTICLIGIGSCLSRPMDAELSAKAVQAVIAVDSTMRLNPRLQLVIDTSSLAKVGISSNAMMKRLKELLSPQVRLGTPSIATACASEVQRACFIFRVLTYRSTDSEVMLRGLWFAYHSEQCTDTMEATYIFDRVGNSMRLNRVIDIDHGSCGKEAPVRLKLRWPN